jgi:hypothetical protein
MSIRCHKITISSTILVKLMDGLHDGIAAAQTETYADPDLQAEHNAEIAAMKETLGDVRRAWEYENLMRRATVLFEDDTMMVFEHPTEGDDAGLMVWSHIYNVGWTDTNFYDAADPDEIRNWIEDLCASA